MPKVASPSKKKEPTKKTQKKTSIIVEKEAVTPEQTVEPVDTKIASMSKQDIIEHFATKSGDTGSPEVQIALSSQKIANLTHHLGENPKDNHSRRGLLKIIAKRRRILHYVQSKDEARYASLVKKLGLKK